MKTNHLKLTSLNIRSPIIHITIIVIIGLFIYANCLKGEFIWDDGPFVEKNLRIRSWNNLGTVFTTNIGFDMLSRSAFYRPLQVFTYMIDYSLWGLDPGAYHIFNILLHILTALALYWLLNILFANKLLSFFSALLFLTHPAQTEAIAYISGRGDPLAGVFIILSLIFYTKYTSLKNKNYCILMFTAFILALLAKENSLIVPGLILVYSFCFRKKLTIRSFGPFFIISLLYLILRLQILKTTPIVICNSGQIIERIPGFFAALPSYFRILIFPFNLNIGYQDTIFPFTSIKTLAGFIIFLSLILAAFKSRRKNKIISFSILWFFVSFLPVSNIFAPLHFYMAEHYLYLPSIGFFLILSSLFCYPYPIKTIRSLAKAAFVFLLIFYSYLAIKQTNYWLEPVSFYKTTLGHAPKNYKMYNNLGNLYKRKGEYQSAINAYKKSISLKPDYKLPYYNMANTYLMINKKDPEPENIKKAIALFRKSLELDSHYTAAYNGLVYIHKKLNQSEQKKK